MVTYYDTRDTFVSAGALKKDVPASVIQGPAGACNSEGVNDECKVGLVTVESTSGGATKYYYPTYACKER